jgi:hypothetical protein
MVRQIAVVLLGMPLNVLRAAAGGARLYHLSDIWSGHMFGAIGRYLYDPLISLIVGVAVRVLTKNHAALGMAGAAFAATCRARLAESSAK